MRIAIVGTGLSSLAVYNSLLSLHPTASITLLDGGKRFTNKKASELQTAEKGKFGSQHMYDTSGSGILFKKRSNFSLAHGGLSTVWGAGIRLWSENLLESIPVDIDSIYREARELLLGIPYSGGADELNFPHRFSIETNPLPPGSKLFEAIKCDDSKTGVKIYRPALAVNVKGSEACRGCGECLTGCPYNSIFDSGVEFDNVINSGNTRHIVGIVESVMESNNQVTVTYTTENSALRNKLDFEHVYLCAGAIGTPAILMRSGYLPKKSKLQIAKSSTS